MKHLRLFIPLFLVIALLFAQQGGVVHSFTHALEEHSRDQSLPHGKHCDLCAIYAQIGSAIGVNHLHFDFDSFAGPVFNTCFLPCRPATLAVFSARAPPRSA